MILPDYTIRALSKNTATPLVDPYDEENLRGSSYDLTIGSEYYIDSGNAFNSLETQPLRNGQSFSIPPHAICFILTTENIQLPKDITAKVSLRMAHIYAGMVLTSQPPFDPEYNGKAIVMLHNLSSAPAYLKGGDRIATIEFSRLENPKQSTKPHTKVESIEKSLSRPLVSSLSEIARKSDLSLERVNMLSGQMLTFAALIVAVLAIPGLFSYNGLSDRISELKDTIEKQNTRISRYQNETKRLKSELIVLQSNQTPAKENSPKPTLSIQPTRMEE